MSEPGRSAMRAPARWVNSTAGRWVASGRILAPPALVGVILLFFNKMAFSNLILARGDTFLYFYPYWSAAAEALRSGRVPLWNPDIFMGAPFLANSQVGFFYPLNWPLWLWLPAPYAVNASILVHISIAAWGAYLAGRRALALEWPAALLAAGLYALGGYLTAQVEHINQLQGLAWLPWYFAVLAPLLPTGGNGLPRRAYLRAGLEVALLMTLQLLAGHTQTVFISGIAVTFWLTIHATGDLAGFSRAREGPTRRRLGHWLRLGGILGAALLLAIALSAAQLIPTLELAGLSSRQGGLPLEEVLSFSWHPLHLTRAILPGYGQSVFTEYAAHLPLTALALAVLGAWKWRKDPAVLPWLLMVVLGSLLALGRFSPVYYLLGRLPGFDLFRAPARWLAVATFGVALLAGYGWQRLWLFTDHDESRHRNRRAAERRELARPLIAAAIGLVVIIAWGFVAGWLAGVIPTGSEAPFRSPGGIALLGWAIELILAAFLFGIILTTPRQRARVAAADLIVLALAALWLGTRTLPYNRLTTPEAYFDARPPQTRLSVFAACAVPGATCSLPPDRFLSLSGIFFDPGDAPEIESIYSDQLAPADIYDYLVAVKHKEVLSPNLSMITGLPAIDGFDGGILPLRSYSNLTQLILPEGVTTTDGRLREFMSAAPDQRWLSLFNGRYLITDKTGDIWREGVFFDRQHPAQITAMPLIVDGAPDYEATDVWLLAGDVPPRVEVTSVDGDIWALVPERIAEPDLYEVPLPAPSRIERIAIQPCPDGGCEVTALSLVDNRDGTFQPLTMPPYRLIYSGDVKIYENLAAQPRAFMVHDWVWASDETAAVATMREPGFEPRETAVILGDGSPPASKNGSLGTATISRYEPEQIHIKTSSNQDGWLVVTDAYYPGWRTTVDGAPAEVKQTNELFRGVFLAAGDHDVVMHYEPSSFRVGTAISLAGLAVMVFISLYLAAATLFKRKSAEPDI